MNDKVKNPLEESVESYLVRQVEARGGIALKGDVPGRRFIDRICILPGGVTVYVEVKRPKGGYRRPHQVETMRRLNDLQHLAFFAKNRDELDQMFIVIDNLIAREERRGR